MSEKTQIILLGIGCFIVGVFILFRHISLAKKMADRVKTNAARVKLYARFIKWTRFDYSEDYYRVGYKFGGVFAIAMSILLFVSVLFGGKEHTAESIGNYVVPTLTITIMIFVLAFIIYVNYRFGNKK